MAASGIFAVPAHLFRNAAGSAGAGGDGAEPSAWLAAHGHRVLHRAIVGDPQEDGLPNPELVESAGPIRVTPLRNMSGHEALLALARLPRYADGTDEDDEPEEPDVDSQEANGAESEGRSAELGNEEDTQPAIAPDAENTRPLGSPAGGDGDMGNSRPLGSAPEPNSESGDRSAELLKEPETVTGTPDSKTGIDTGKPSQSTTPNPEPGTPKLTPLAPWWMVNDQRKTVGAPRKTAVAPSMPGATLGDVLDYGQRMGHTPEQTANLVKAWHRQAVDYASKNAPPLGYFAGANQADWDTQHALDTLRQFSSQPGDKKNPTFAIPRQPTDALSIDGSDGQALAYYQPRFRPDGSLDLLMNMPDQENGGIQHGLLNVPAVTQDDIDKARKEAENQAAQLSQRAEEVEDRDRSAAATGDESLYSVFGSRAANALRQQALDATTRAARLSDPRQGWAMLTTERATDALRKSPLADKVGRSGLGPVLENFARSVDGFAIKTGILLDDAIGNKKLLAQDQQELRDLQQMLPGDTGSQFRGGRRAAPGQVSTFLGNAAPAIATSPIPGASAITMGVQAAGDVDASALENAARLDAQAAELRSKGNLDMASQAAAQAQQIRDNRALAAISSGVLNAAAGRALPELSGETSFGKGVLRGTLGMGGVAGIQGTMIDPLVGNHPTFGQMATQAAFGGVLGGFHQKLDALRGTPPGEAGAAAPRAPSPPPPAPYEPRTVFGDGELQWSTPWPPSALDVSPQKFSAELSQEAYAGVPPPAPGDIVPVHPLLRPEEIGSPPPAPVGVAENLPPKAGSADSPASLSGEGDVDLSDVAHAVSPTSATGSLESASSSSAEPTPQSEELESESAAVTASASSKSGAKSAANAGSGGGNSPRTPSNATPAEKPASSSSAKSGALPLKPYKEGRGHHLPAKSMFRKHPLYDPDKELAVPNDTMEDKNIDHPTVTGAQRSLYRAYAKTGKPLTWEAVRRIETQAMLTEKFKDREAALATVNKAIDALIAKGVKPTRIPWGGK